MENIKLKGKNLESWMDDKRKKWVIEQMFNDYKNMCVIYLFLCILVTEWIKSSSINLCSNKDEIEIVTYHLISDIQFILCRT